MGEGKRTKIGAAAAIVHVGVIGQRSDLRGERCGTNAREDHEQQYLAARKPAAAARGGCPTVVRVFEGQ
jgi:hypothetical protein